MRKFKKILACALAVVMTLTTLLPAVPASALETEDGVSAQRGQVISLGTDDIFEASTVETETKTTAQNWQWMVTNASAGNVTADGTVNGVNGQYIVYLGEYDLTDINEIVIDVASTNSTQIKGNLSIDFTLADMSTVQENNNVTVDTSCSNFKVYSGGAWDYGMDTTTSGTQLGEINSSSPTCSISAASQTGTHALYYRQYMPNNASNAATCSLTAITFVGEKNVSDFTDLHVNSVSGPSGAANAATLGMVVANDTFTWNTRGVSNEQAGTYTVSFTAQGTGGTTVDKTVTMTLKTAPDATETVGTTVKPGTETLTAQRGQSISLSGEDVFGKETKTLGFTTDASGWNWMLTESGSGSVTADGVKDLNARYSRRG